MCDFCNGKESYKTAYGEFKIKKLGYINVIQCHIDKCPQYAKCCMAYKTMDEIIGNIKDTVEIVDIIKPIYNFKANE